MNAVYSLRPTVGGVEVIPPNPDYIAIIRLTLERWPDMTPEQRAEFTDVVMMLGNPPMIVDPSNLGQAGVDAGAGLPQGAS